MEEPQGVNDGAPLRGTKRKLSVGVDGKVNRLTPSQKLAAARKAARLANSRHTDADADADAAVGAGDVMRPENREARAPQAQKHDDEYFRDLYKGELDFQALKRDDEEFAVCLKDDRYLDFGDPKSVMQLTNTLLKRDFGIKIKLLVDRLCPPVPNRHNYILWLKDLLDTSSPSYADAYEKDRQITGLDIGTGASAIYPLLGCVQRSAWSFIATDIDALSLGNARTNAELNHLESRIRIVARPVEAHLIPLDELEVDNIDFVMTNPPFYSSETELLELSKQKDGPPSSVCTGSPNEMVCSGGEVGFIRRILEESLVLRTRVQWYTSMLGKLSSLETVINMLKEHEISNYAVTSFIQGNKTRRWAVGWSFGTRRPSSKACRGLEAIAGKKSLLPPLTEITVAAKIAQEGAGKQLENVFWTQLEDVTEGLDLVSWDLDEEDLRGVGFAEGNVWSRVYRRGKDRRIATSAPRDGKFGGEVDVSQCAFGFSIRIQTVKELGEGDSVTVTLRWLQGTDPGMFESFAGMLRNAFQNVLTSG
jgi:23S rRNA (adenine1618-N6)-methyltransferase